MATKTKKECTKKAAAAVSKLADYVGTLSCLDKPEPTQLAAKVDENLLAKWPKVKMKVPTIFLHKTVDFATHVTEILGLDIKFYQPYLSSNYTKIICPTFEDHEALLQYFDERNLPFHTFGNPEQLKMRVVIRGLPPGTELGAVAVALRAAGVPLVRAHPMHVKQFAVDRELVVLAVVPHTADGRHILRVQRLLGHAVTLEPAIHKTQQCYRCQRWGHAQRYCGGALRCVSCAGEHWSAACGRDRREPPTCANCGGAHTASYRQCFHCPDAPDYQLRKNRKPHVKASAKQIVTQHIADTNLYKKINHIPKHAEAIPF